jgi:CPA1 family monovalent cation:H+ antiporter
MLAGFELTPFDAAAILIVIAAVLGYINARVLKLPSSIGLTVMGAVASLLVVGIDRVVPGSRFGRDVVSFIEAIDFHTTLMNGMLSFLLFAGALHVEWAEVRRGRWPIVILSTVGTMLSTVITGFGFRLLCELVGLSIPLSWALVFGALISPTDPVAVIGVLKRAKVSPTLEATVAGESLFNDGIGVVIFAILLSVALGSEPLSLSNAAYLFALEAGGGIVLGLVIGWLGFRAMSKIDEYNVEVMITLAVVMGGYAVASQLHVSGPVAMAVAGLIIGSESVVCTMSDLTRDYLLKFWTVIDDLLNAVLFLLIGLVVVTIPWDPRFLVLGLMTVPLVLLARATAVAGLMAGLRPFLNLGRLAVPTLVWGGLRGGISIALALGLPSGTARSIALSATYVVVLFSVIVQGGTIARLVRRMQRSDHERKTVALSRAHIEPPAKSTG